MSASTKNIINVMNVIRIKSVFIVYILYLKNRSKNKNGVCRTRDKNSAISIMKLAKEWLNTQTRPKEFQFKHTPSPCITSVKARNEIRQS